MKLTRTERTLLQDLEAASPQDRPIWYQPQDLSSPRRAATLDKFLERGWVERKGPSRTAAYRGYVWRITSAGQAALEVTAP